MELSPPSFTQLDESEGKKKNGTGPSVRFFVGVR